MNSKSLEDSALPTVQKAVSMALFGRAAQLFKLTQQYQKSVSIRIDATIFYVLTRYRSDYLKYIQDPDNVIRQTMLDNTLIGASLGNTSMAFLAEIAYKYKYPVALLVNSMYGYIIAANHRDEYIDYIKCLYTGK